MFTHNWLMESLAAPNPENLLGSGFPHGLLIVSVFSLLVWFMTVESGGGPLVKAGKHFNGDGTPVMFTLSLGEELVTLDPGKAWIKVDHHKWVTRGLIEPPQSFHVLADGTVEINGEKIHLTDSDGVEQLQHEVNKSHVVSAESTSQVALRLARALGAATTHHPNQVLFKVRVDHLGHLMIECHHGAEKVETGMRGLQVLVANGLMLPPKKTHVDPLQRAIELDDVRYECSDAGAHDLENALNAKYVPPPQAEGEGVIAIRENPAAPAGFDIHFVTYHSGMRFEVKGHLCQEKLDILQDPNHCDLLRPDIEFRIAPPQLLIRRKRADGGEEHIPELPDVQYRRTTVAELQRIFNHPLVRRHQSDDGEKAPVKAMKPAPVGIREIHVTRNPVNRMLLWLSLISVDESEPHGMALTHHNVAELLHHGVFQSHLDIVLSLDSQRLSVLDKETRKEECLVLTPNSSDEDLRRAGQLLTASLQPANER